MSFTLRLAEEADSARIAELLTQLGYPATGDEVNERLAYWVPEPMSRVFVAVRDGLVIGSMSVHAIPYLERPGRWLRIESLVVDESERAAGVGRALVGAAHDIAREWNCTAIEVTSSRQRRGAHAFYARLGFQDACERSARFFKTLTER